MRTCGWLAVIWLTSACTRTVPTPEAVPPSDEVTLRSQDHMSTYVTISVAAPESRELLEAIDAAFAEVRRLQTVLSEWRDDSEINRVNEQAGQAPVHVGGELFDVIAMAHDVSLASEGAFDITFAALHDLWDFGSSTPRVPQAEVLAQRLALVDYRNLVLDRRARTVRLARPGMRIGLGGIAKGTVVDAASAVLSRRGFVNHLIVAGGDLYASGRKKTRRWKIGVRAPKGQGLYGTLEVENEGVATSGNYERFFVKDGKRYHHILSPKTGMPAVGLSSVTVVAQNAGWADAFSTALFVLGPEEGLSLATRRDDLEALLFDEEFVPRMTPGFQSRLAVFEAAIPNAIQHDEAPGGLPPRVP